jgi:hypothetical protein
MPEHYHIDNKLDTLREKKSQYERLKKGLMQKLLTGEIRRPYDLAGFGFFDGDDRRSGAICLPG